MIAVLKHSQVWGIIINEDNCPLCGIYINNKGQNIINIAIDNYFEGMFM